MSKRLIASLLLLLTAMIWGVAFVVQKGAMNTIPPFFFNGARLLLAGITLLPLSVLRGRRERGLLRGDETACRAEWKARRRSLALSGVVCGACLFLGASFQQLGLCHISAGKAGFLAALYIVLVPLCGLFVGHAPRAQVWLAVVVSAVGVYLLCVTEKLTIGLGECYMFISVSFFTAHILVVARASQRVDCVRLSCVQLTFAGLMSLAVAFVIEKPTLGALVENWPGILYLGVLSGGLGYTLQILGQRDTDPTVASLLMCLESVFAVLAAWIFTGDLLSGRELFGCALMLGGIVLAQLPLPQKRPRAA